MDVQPLNVNHSSIVYNEESASSAFWQIVTSLQWNADLTTDHHDVATTSYGNPASHWHVGHHYLIVTLNVEIENATLLWNMNGDCVD